MVNCTEVRKTAMKGRYPDMKKITALVLAMLLTLCLASGALADTFTTKYFTLELPEGWEIDTDDLEEESEEGMEALGFFAGPEDVALMAGAYLVYYEELKDLSLWEASEEDLREYAEIIIDELQDDNAEYIGTVTAGKIPFVLIRCEDEESEYIYADTVTNGYSIQFQAFMADEENFHPLTDEAIEQFTTILATFKPAA